MEIPNNTELKVFLGVGRTQLAVDVCFLILKHWFSETAKKTCPSYSFATQAI